MYYYHQNTKQLKNEMKPLKGDKTCKCTEYSIFYIRLSFLLEHLKHVQNLASNIHELKNLAIFSSPTIVFKYVKPVKRRR